MIALPPGACVVSDPLRAPTAGAFPSSLPSLSLSPARPGAHAMCPVRQLGAALGIPGAGGDSCSLELRVCATRGCRRACEKAEVSPAPPSSHRLLESRGGGAWLAAEGEAGPGSSDWAGFGFYPGCGKRGQGRVSCMRDPEAIPSLSRKANHFASAGEKKSIGRAKRLFPRLQWHHLRFVSWDGKRAFVKVTGAPDSSSLLPGKCTALVASCWRVGLGRPDASPWLEGGSQRR